MSLHTNLLATLITTLTTVATVLLYGVRPYQAAHMGRGIGSIGTLLSASDPH